MPAHNVRHMLVGSRVTWPLTLRYEKVNINPVCIALRQKHNNSATTIFRLTWNNMFGKYLLLTNTVGSGILMVAGDVILQEYEIQTNDVKDNANNNNLMRYDRGRMERMFIAGALMGPLHHYVYGWMEKVWPVPSVKNTLRKILIDELVMSPLCIFIFFYSTCYLEKKSLKETNEELKAKFLFMYFVDWLTWPAIQYVNFRYINPKYRVTIVNIFTTIYNVFVSYMKHNYEWNI